MKKILLYSVIAATTLSSCSVLRSLGIEPSTFETISALREVLNSSTFKAIASLAQLKNGGIESLLPKELQPVLSTLNTLGLGAEVDKLSQTIGTVAGDVAKESGGLMTDAIGQLNFGDAVAVVTGGPDAATLVLKNAMYGAVKKRYSSRLEQEFNKTPEVMEYWGLATGAYNLFSKDKISGSLPDYVAERSVDVLFLTMGKEEGKIRKDPASLGKAVVTKVFDYYTGSKK